jgi:phytanoyl-CoA hydroxylase
LKIENEKSTKPTVPVEQRRTSLGSLTPEQIRHYDEEGYLVLPDLLDARDMQPPIEAMSEKVSEIIDELHRDGRIPSKLEDRPFESRLAEAFAGLDESDFLKYGAGWRDRKPGYYHLMSNPKVVDAVESLIGGEIFSNPVYNVRPKVPKVAAGAVPWHQDKSYWPDANSNPVITVWIALVDATLENGCLHVLPRTHRTKYLSWRQTDVSFKEGSGSTYRELDTEHVSKKRVLPLPVKAGWAILFNDRCIHMSTPNNSSTVRWSVDLRYQPTDQDPMRKYGDGFLVRSRQFPERVAHLDDWLAHRLAACRT